MSDEPPVVDDDEEIEEEPESPFVMWLKEHRGGALLYELEEAFSEVIQAVQRHGKKGSVDLKIAIGAHGRTVEVTDDVKAKPPREPRTGDIFFPDLQGALHREDPAQMSLKFNEVPAHDGTLRVIDTDTGELRRAGGSK